MATRQSFTASQVLTAAQCNDLATAMVAINAQTGTTYTTVLTDDGKLVTLNNAAAITLTVPLNATVAYGIGTQINLMQLGAGQVTISPTGGVTINSSGTKLKLNGQYAVATIVKTGTDTWVAVGNLTA